MLPGTVVDFEESWVEPDYDAERVAAIEGIAWKPKRDNESLADYYGRMYATAG